MDTKDNAGNPPVPNCRDREGMIDRISEEEKRQIVLLSPAVGKVCTQKGRRFTAFARERGGAHSFFFSFTVSALFCGAVTSPLRRKRANQVDHANIP